MGKEPAGRHQPTPSGDVADQTVFPVQLLGEGIKQKKTPTDVRVCFRNEWKRIEGC